uniref:HDC14832 n=1 Tax=Drosophila melanogaster TaxID=7227 RepID=Q6IJJ2_DROME|nr:TPA_inf: HDC14832 [Drosophila melanogaster]
MNCPIDPLEYPEAAFYLANCCLLTARNELISELWFQPRQILGQCQSIQQLSDGSYGSDVVASLIGVN